MLWKKNLFFYHTVCTTCQLRPTHAHTNRKKETESSWFHLLTQLKWDYITRNGRNSRFCLELGTYSKDTGEKRFKTDLDSVNELTREQCVTTHTLHLTRIDQIHKNVQYKWLKKGYMCFKGRGDLSAWLEFLMVIGVLPVGCSFWQCLYWLGKVIMITWSPYHSRAVQTVAAAALKSSN